MAEKMVVSKSTVVLAVLMMLAIVATADHKACCDGCGCTKSIPPQCRCADVKDHCHSKCKSCLCTKSLPPQCRCADVNNFCYPKC
ncbi:hypothetical protein MKW98_006302 [Papaver atlanticum]|uniref:Bowman-Birk serine protease inhibitors family domain-containing protein n=1 Tax=Papaver atlanticum TaxID=357466 RepID=A0AAD4XXN5_9MAGN|nr:hypothetical protein MKW98_006302 [Papaver atlanticum]